MLRLLTEPPSKIVTGEHTCEFCNFQEQYQFKSFKDKEEHIACVECFASLHAASASSQEYSIVWLPEISQEDLSHLSRVLAVILYRYAPKDSKTPSRTQIKPKPHTAWTNAREITMALRDRVAQTSRFLSLLESIHELDDVGEIDHGSDEDRLIDKDTATWRLEKILSNKNLKHRNKIVSAMRLLPIQFDLDRINCWTNHDGSLFGYGSDNLNKAGWFATEIDLDEKAINYLHTLSGMEPLIPKKTELNKLPEIPEFAEWED